MFISNHYNWCKGKPVIIVGCGPSMTDNIAEKLMAMNVVTIGVNHCFLYNDMQFKPTYHFCNDYQTEFIYVYHDILKELGDSGTALVMPFQVPNVYREDFNNVLLYHLAEGDQKYRFITYADNKNSPWFSRGLSIAFTALQFAAYLGANPICLIGVDFTIGQDNKFHNYDVSPLPVKAAERLRDKILPERMHHIAEYAAPALAELNTTVLNFSKMSKLECFLKPDNTLEESLRWLSQSPSTGHQRAEQQTAIRA